MTPTRFVAPVPVPTEPYVDRLNRMVLSLTNGTAMQDKRGQTIRVEAAAFIQEQARMIVRLEGELQDAYAEH